ncbi:MAG TPA: chemotaxis protein CheW [Terriglobales bacterium]|nr:chemotaxis protein CheW [Terriglobales bacterium]
MAKELQIVGFRVGQETFGVPIASVQEILRPLPVTPVPGAPPHVEGVINLRGRIVSVVDLRKRCGAPAESHRRNRIVVAETEGRRIGLMVDSASEVLRIAENTIEPPASVFGEAEPGFVTGVAKLANRLVILVDLAKLLASGSTPPEAQ